MSVVLKRMFEGDEHMFENVDSKMSYHKCRLRLQETEKLGQETRECCASFCDGRIHDHMGFWILHDAITANGC